MGITLQEFRKSAAVDAHEQRLWAQVEYAAVGPWFLGTVSRPSTYLSIAVMTHWRPRQGWFATHAPVVAEVGLGGATPASGGAG